LLFPPPHPDYVEGVDMLVETATGIRKSANITRMQPRDVSTMKPGWTPGFNWRLYFRYKNVELYKIMVSGSTRIEGALALEPREDHVWVHLIEKAPFNRGVTEQYQYVAHHLFAFAAYRSFQMGLDGFVAFEAKTGLIEHYRRTYGAIQIGNGLRMFIPDLAAKQLIDVYLR
jgi:hypothetical protein